MRLVWDLVRRPIWVAGLLCAVATVILQFVALAVGELALIQPLLLLGLLFALPISVVLEKCKPSAREWGWAAVLVVGLTLFLASAHPRQGPSLAKDRWMFELGVGSLLVIGGLILLGWKAARRHRAALLGLATGIAYGMSAALMKYCYGLASDRPTRLLTSWPGYTLVIVGGGAIFLNQLAYRSGPLAGALPPLAIADPLVATVFGVAAFAESLRTTAGAVAMQVVGVIILVVAIVRLASYAAGRDALEPHTADERAAARSREAALTG